MGSPDLDGVCSSLKSELGKGEVTNADDQVTYPSCPQEAGSGQTSFRGGQAAVQESQRGSRPSLEAVGGVIRDRRSSDRNQNLEYSKRDDHLVSASWTFSSYKERPDCP